MATFREVEESLKSFIIQEQSDAHHKGSYNASKYNNIKISVNPTRNPMPHVIIRISISEAIFSLATFTKINGSLGYEERFILKWFGRYGIKEKLRELWGSEEKSVSGK